MSKYLDPKADLTFKKIFGRHPNLVISLLNALLPFPKGMEIVSVEYLSNDNVPDNPGKKYSIVDVNCTDNFGRHFIVEMQSYWNTEFFPRTLFNVTSAYSRQLAKGSSFGELKDVYALCLVNDIKAFPEYGGEYLQEYYLTNKNHPADHRTDLSIFFFILPNFKPQNRAEQKMHDLWLRFLTEIDENTIDASPDFLANPDTKQALDILLTSAFTDDELRAYHKYWLDVSTERSALEKEYTKGHAQGHAQGLAEGEKKALLATARNAKSMGLPTDQIALLTGLTPAEIAAL